ncbi:ATP synthase subunit I [Ningiella sp. W23]|uniref:ATP synthase subunit I n=1 Tax=Ningiella sp. W23 TaxID=3023715 RepID=UPI00375770C2
MSADLAKPGRDLAKKVVLVEILVSVILILSVSVIQPTSLLAVAFGSAACAFPHSIFAYWMFRYAGASKNNLVAQSLSQGMKIKLALTTIIFVIAFSQFDVHPLPLLGAYAIVQVSQWLAMFCLRN